MTADTETVGRATASKAATPWPLLQNNLRRARAVPNQRLRSWGEQMMLRLALAWLSLAIAWAGFRAAADLMLRRWGR